MNRNLLGVGLASAFIACGQDLEGHNQQNYQPNCHNITIMVTNQTETVLIVDGYSKQLIDHGTNLLTSEVEICNGIRTRIAIISANQGELHLFSHETNNFGIDLIDLESDTIVSCTDVKNSRYTEFSYTAGINDLALEIVDGCQ